MPAGCVRSDLRRWADGRQRAMLQLCCPTGSTSPLVWWAEQHNIRPDGDFVCILSVAPVLNSGIKKAGWYAGRIADGAVAAVITMQE